MKPSEIYDDLFYFTLGGEEEGEEGGEEEGENLEAREAKRWASYEKDLRREAEFEREQEREREILENSDIKPEGKRGRESVENEALEGFEREQERGMESVETSTPPRTKRGGGSTVIPGGYLPKEFRWNQVRLGFIWGIGRFWDHNPLCVFLCFQ